MIVRATSDLHLAQHTAPYVFEALEQLKEDAAQHGGATVLAGDVFDQGLTAHMPTWNRLRDMLREWNGLLFVVPGNHDQYSGHRNILEGLGGEDHITILSTGGAHAIGLFVPYCKPELFPERLAAVQALHVEAAPVVWCHHGFKGAYVNSMRRDVDGVPFNAIPEGHLAISGHYHMPQNIAQLIYLGSPYECSFHEEGQGKGWLRWADFPYDRYVIPERIAYETSAPKHFTVRWDPSEGPPNRPVGIRDHDIVRVVTEVTRAEAQAAAKQLESAGLAAAPVLVQPYGGASRPMVFNPFMELREVVNQYAHDRYATETVGPEPEDMKEWAERHQLWAGL